MTGTLLMKVLVCQYLVLAAVFAYELNWPKCSYWIGAAIITTSVLVMK
jgi:hypothetical protein